MLKIGDRVIVRSERFADQNGLTGTVISTTNGNLPIRIQYDAGQNEHLFFASRNWASEGTTNCYSKECLVCIPIMADIDMSLDEIHKAQEIMESLK